MNKAASLTLLLSLAATLLACLAAILATALFSPELRNWWNGGKIAICLAAIGWFVFFVPFLIWERCRHRWLDPEDLARAGAIFGSLPAASAWLANGSLFWVWNGQKTPALTLLAIPTGMLAGLLFGRLRERSKALCNRRRSLHARG